MHDRLVAGTSVQSGVEQELEHTVEPDCGLERSGEAGGHAGERRVPGVQHEQREDGRDRDVDPRSHDRRLEELDDLG